MAMMVKKGLSLYDNKVIRGKAFYFN